MGKHERDVRPALPFAGLPINHFGAFLADPPYHFSTYSKRGQGRSPSQHYSDVSIDELMTLPVADLAAECLLGDVLQGFFFDLSEEVDGMREGLFGRSYPAEPGAKPGAFAAFLKRFGLDV